METHVETRLPYASTDGDERFCPRCGAIRHPARGMHSAVCESCILSLALEELRANDPKAAPEVQTARVERSLGSYSLMDEIGRGGMGVIYRAVHNQTGQTVALKTILPEYVGCTETRARFGREARAASSLDHPNVMPIYEIGEETDETPFFCMKLAEYGNLHQLIEKFGGRWRQIAELMAKVAAAVHHAHQRGVLHRDLKPGNILFDEDHEPLVTDFGLAKHLTTSAALTQSCSILGTPSYVAPEQAAGNTKDVSAATDVYGLGTILYELLTGRPPFVGENALDVLHQATRCAPVRPSKFVRRIPKALEAVCMRCLERRPCDRYESAQSFADDLGRWLQGRPIINRPKIAGMRRTLMRCLTGRAWYLGGGGLALTLFMAWLSVGRGKSNPSEGSAIAVAIDDMDQDAPLKLVAQQATDELKRELADARIFKLQDGEEKAGQFPSGQFDPLLYGRSRNAQIVLTGCVRQTGGAVRLATRLMRCDTGETVWRHFDALPSDRSAATLHGVARAIVSALEIKWNADPHSLAQASKYCALPDAQACYTRAIEFSTRANRSDLNTATGLFQRAYKLDSHFAAARAMHAFALWVAADTYGELERLPLAMSIAKEAVLLDPNSAQAYRVIASCELKNGHASEALEGFWRALEINPQSAGCCQSLALCLRETGHLKQAIPWLKRAAQLEPARYPVGGMLAEILIQCGRDDQAEVLLKHAIDLDADQPELQIALSALRTWQGRFGEARQLCMQTSRRFPDNRYGNTLAAWIEFCGGQTDAVHCLEDLRAERAYQRDWEFYGAVNPSSALAYLAERSGSNERAKSLSDEAMRLDHELLAKHPHNPRILHDLAATCAIIGETQKGLEYLNESISAGWTEQRSTKIDPRFSNLASLPRFKEILGKISTD